VSAIDVHLLPVGHPARAAAARALVVTAVSAVVFTVFAFVTTQVKVVRAVSPWQDDPYDAVVTFTLFFVPGLSVVTALRTLLCRRAQPLPVYRIEQILRAGVLVLALIEITVLSDWIALVLRADRQLWSDRTPLLVLALAIVTVLAATSHVLARRTRTMTPRQRLDDGDWLDDVIVGVDVLAAGRAADASRFGGLRRLLLVVVSFTRAHFVVMTALGSAVVSGLVIGQLAVAEGSANALLIVVEAVVFAGGTFGFVMIADAWLRLAAAPRRAKHTVARVGSTVAALALPASLAVRDLIWSATGHPAEVQTAEQLAVLTFTSAAVCGVVASVVSYAIVTSSARHE
jgi:hypothetical protein